MKKGNFVDLPVEESKLEQSIKSIERKISRELEEAIESLIFQLRELGPIQTA